MKLESLRTFRTHLQIDLSKDAISFQIYYYQRNWHDLDTEKQCNKSDSAHLEQARINPIGHCEKSSLIAWFYLAESDCAVRLHFAKSPQKNTRKQALERLKGLQGTASNAYRVAHNQLTHLLARDAFRRKLQAEILDLGGGRGDESDAQDPSIPKTLAVLALDIDHFKQINDTRGHLYGDQVLKTLAIRLEASAKKIKSSGTNIEIHLGHPSGEEFLILITANAGKDQFTEWGNDFRRSISDDALPNDSEWKSLDAQKGSVVLPPPPLHERSVTISIGLAIHNVAPVGTSNSDPVAGLLERADTALYRAKASGRNQVISYDSILSHFGRTLEHDNITGVVVLDIGSNVGVSVGQEFRIYSPTYSGKKKFQINDGRSIRTLGIYPKVELARIVAFDVQPEVSFAYIDSPRERSISIEAGSHAEAIPTGSIGHLLASSSRFSRASLGTEDRNVVEDIQKFAQVASDTGKEPFAVVTRFSNEVSYLKAYGSVAYNFALAHLYREAKLKFSEAKYVEVVDRGAICITGEQSSYSEEKVSNFAKKMALDFPELGVVSGVCCELDISKSEEDEAVSPLDRSKVFEFARFAASDAGRTSEEYVRHFSYKSSCEVLQALRTSRSFEVAEADYCQLIKFGVESAFLLNLGGLISSSMENAQLAMDRYESAANRDPKTLIYKSNFVTASYKSGKMEAGLKMLNDVPIELVQSLKNTHPFGYAAYARLLAEAKKNGSSLFIQSRFLAVAPLALNLPDYKNPRMLTFVREVFEELSQG